MNRIIIILTIILTLSPGCSNKTSEQNVEQWNVYEITLNGPLTGNPFMEVELAAIFNNKSESIKVPGFYDGNGVYRIRFSPPAQGIWKYKTSSNVPALADKQGMFR